MCTSKTHCKLQAADAGGPMLSSSTSAPTSGASIPAVKGCAARRIMGHKRSSPAVGKFEVAQVGVAQKGTPAMQQMSGGDRDTTRRRRPRQVGGKLPCVGGAASTHIRQPRPQLTWLLGSMRHYRGVGPPARCFAAFASVYGSSENEHAFTRGLEIDCSHRRRSGRCFRPLLGRRRRCRSRRGRLRVPRLYCRPSRT